MRWLTIIQRVRVSLCSQFYVHVADNCTLTAKLGVHIRGDNVSERNLTVGTTLKETIVQFDAGYFCAGAVIKDGVVIAAAPIIKWMIGKRLSEITPYTDKKKWKRIQVNGL